MVFIATTHEYEAGLDNKLIRERRIMIYCLIYVYPLTVEDEFCLFAFFCF